ncbi:MAG: Rsd/AlgQ family anti-sigma factor [Succinivibrionaceae bacterium]
MLLTTLNRTKQVSKGNLKWINEMIEAREKLILLYFKIASLPIDEDLKNKKDMTSTCEQISLFCNQLVDYLSRGHFIIYPKILTIMETVSNRRLSIARRLVPRIENTTEQLLRFNDEYGEDLKGEKLTRIRKALGFVGQWLEIRFKHEDRMVIALQILDNTMANATKNMVVDKN